jgi:hypothetical protein
MRFVMFMIPAVYQGEKGKKAGADFAPPADEGDVIEVRQVFEVEEFPPDVQKAAQHPTVEAAIQKKP